MEKFGSLDPQVNGRACGATGSSLNHGYTRVDTDRRMEELHSSVDLCPSVVLLPICPLLLPPFQQRTTWSSVHLRSPNAKRRSPDGIVHGPCCGAPTNSLTMRSSARVGRSCGNTVRPHGYVAPWQDRLSPLRTSGVHPPKPSTRSGNARPHSRTTPRRWRAPRRRMHRLRRHL